CFSSIPTPQPPRLPLFPYTTLFRSDLGDGGSAPVGGLCSRQELRLAMLEAQVVTAPAEELEWFVHETDALKKVRSAAPVEARLRSEEHTSELQSLTNLLCLLLLEQQ